MLNSHAESRFVSSPNLSNESNIYNNGRDTVTELSPTNPNAPSLLYGRGNSRAGFITMTFLPFPPTINFNIAATKIIEIPGANAAQSLTTLFNLPPASNVASSGKVFNGLITGLDFVPKMNALMPIVALKKSSSELGLDIVTPTEFSWSNKQNIAADRYFNAIDPNSIPYISPPVDQGECGACYAISTATHFNDRWNIWSLTKERINVSYQELLNCMGGGCDGGFPYEVCLYLETYGLPTYEQYVGAKRTCTKNTRSTRYKSLAGSSYSVGAVDEKKSQLEIQREIYENGPAVAGMAVFSDLRTYTKGVYRKNSDEFLGIHAVVIVGWCVEDGVSAWIVRNSWGSRWGDQGFFKIAFGECGIDSFNLTKFMSIASASNSTPEVYKETKFGGIVATFPNTGRKVPEHMLKILAQARAPTRSVSSDKHYLIYLIILVCVGIGYLIYRRGLKKQSKH